MYDAERKRLAAFKKCKAKEKHISSKKAYDHCPSCQKVVNNVNNSGVGKVAGESDIQSLIDYMQDIIIESNKKLDETLAL